MSTQTEYIGYNSAATGLFQQSGGTHTASYLSIGQNGQYLFTGGALQINGGLDNQGILDFGGGTATMTVAANSIVNLADGGSVLNSQGASLSIGANSLLIVPAGFDPTTAFAHYSNAGMLHVAGTTLTIASGQTISARGPSTTT